MPFLSLLLCPYLNISLALCLPPAFFLRLKKRMQMIGGGVQGRFRAPSWSCSASLRVIRKCTDMLICTKPALLMKTQYRLPFIRLIMKYQYHVPSYTASVNRTQAEYASMQAHLDRGPSINPEIAPYGCKTLQLLMDTSSFWVR